ncbi:unnamed protein product [Penicillium salamii]|uniref:N-acetyltransferase domain-containing protein n=1 Tax=Penicillium salamii TaxID=1612424 RepID=A0A9W4NQ58_9EURO|nr:unnamed protein product [Penicillium salamii]CAG8116322.1 unnamed protein product [Penicillium salamii]CAG8129635.1 unnamed protein product [Penicillium salamii]CAG8264743.1 unnamed protein product [Penicillium salamii]CAG8295343.1 unnamed protein product [Penicillium salamii]
MSSESTVILVPWDPESISHRQVLFEQRVECSWHQEKVEKEWRDLQVRGAKCVYWIVCEELQDTATSINAVRREPSRRTFIPVGHISLDSENPDNEGVELDIPESNAFWIKTFYVIHAVQSQGVGRAAMDLVEEMAVREPLNAKTLLLDTVHKDDQLQEDFAVATYGSVPKVRLSGLDIFMIITHTLQSATQVWYARRGYRLIKTLPHHYKNIPDKNGKYWDMRTVFMRKDIG